MSLLERIIRGAVRPSLFVLLAWLVSGTVAHADDLPFVTVTANRYEESNQQVPVGITTISADDAEKVGVTDAQSLAAVVPGLLYKNIQVTQILSAVSHITNAARATIKGIDLDISAVPVDRLVLTASLEAMQGKYDSFPNGTFFVYEPTTGGNCTFAVAAPPAPVPCGGVHPPNYDAGTGTWDLRGNRTVQTPPFSASLIGQYDIPTLLGRFDINLSWTHTGNYYASADNGKGQIAPSSSNNDMQKLIDVFNGSLGWHSSNRDLEVRLWAKNLTNLRYWSYADEISFATFYSPAPPRALGVTVTRRFE